MKKNIKSLNNIKKTKTEQIDYKSNYLRALADYQNLEKRLLEEKENLIKNASKHLIIKLLPILDNIEKAQIFVKDQGLNIIKQDLLNIFKNEGLEEVNVNGQKFNPEFAEAVSIVEGENDSKIIDTIRKGYKLNGKVIRPAQVKVEKKVDVNKITS